MPSNGASALDGWDVITGGGLATQGSKKLNNNKVNDAFRKRRLSKWRLSGNTTTKV